MNDPFNNASLEYLAEATLYAGHDFRSRRTVRRAVYLKAETVGEILVELAELPKDARLERGEGTTFVEFTELETEKEVEERIARVWRHVQSAVKKERETYERLRKFEK
jgi:hypothetical protein